MRTKISVLILLLFLAGVDVILYSHAKASISYSNQTGQQQPAQATSSGQSAIPVSTPSTPKTPVSVPVSTTPSYTLADVSKHSNATSCWSAINGNVYDLTSWINQHPGGPEAILSICGVDGSAAFNDQHGGQRRPANELAGFMIGTLTK